MSSKTKPEEARGRKIAARRDAVSIAVISAAAGIVCVQFDISEKLMGWAHRHERLQVDELPAVLLVIATCLIWFSTRRYIEARRQLELRRAADSRLGEALAQNQRLAQQYVEMQEYERKALARDLHDELGQYLNVIKLDAVAIRDARTPANPQVSAVARGMIENVDRVYGVVAGLIHQLRPVAFDELGVAAALEHCVNDWRARLMDTRIVLAVETNLDGLDEIRALALFRVVQEAMTNVARHAAAKQVTISIVRGQGSAGRPNIDVSVADDGVGMNLDARRDGLGLVGMRERVAALGGTFRLSSRPGDGLKMMASIPVWVAAPAEPES